MGPLLGSHLLILYTKDAQLRVYDIVKSLHIYTLEASLVINLHNLLSSDPRRLFRLNSLKLVKTSFLSKVWIFKSSSTWKPRPGTRLTPPFSKWHTQAAGISLHIFISFHEEVLGTFFFLSVNISIIVCKIRDCTAEINHGLLCVWGITQPNKLLLFFNIFRCHNFFQYLTSQDSTR